MSSTEWGLNLYWRGLLARVASLERYGVIFVLDADGDGMEAQIPRALKGTGIREGVRKDKPALLEAVRLREGLCAVCGMDKAKHPKREGKANHWDAQAMQVISANCSSLSVYPMYCSSCWESRIMWKGLTEKRTSATSQKIREKDSCDDPDAPLRRGRKTAPDGIGDSGGEGVAVLSFTAD